MPREADPLAVLEPIARVAEALRQDCVSRFPGPTALGCGVSGYLDPTRRLVRLNNTPALNGFALASWMEDRFGLPTSLDNDACMAAVAEAALLGPQEAQRVLFVAVGSGIGVVLVVDGRVVRIMRGISGDAGHILVAQLSDERCPLGCRGCLETVASGRAIARAGRRAAADGSSPLLAKMASERGDLTGADVSMAAGQGDPAARDAIREAGNWLGVGMASWAATYAPDIILLGGGVAQAGDEWLAAAVSAMRSSGMPFFVDKVEVRRAVFGDRAGMIGAALVALREAPKGPPGGGG